MVIADVHRTGGHRGGEWQVSGYGRAHPEHPGRLQHQRDPAAAVGVAAAVVGAAVATVAVAVGAAVLVATGVRVAAGAGGAGFRAETGGRVPAIGGRGVDGGGVGCPELTGAADEVEAAAGTAADVVTGPAGNGRSAVGFVALPRAPYTTEVQSTATASASSAAAASSRIGPGRRRAAPPRLSIRIAPDPRAGVGPGFVSRKAQKGPRRNRSQIAGHPLNAPRHGLVVGDDGDTGSRRDSVVVEKLEPGGRRARRTLAVLAAVLIVGLSMLPGTAARADTTYVKFYTVTTSYQGAPENLSEIAGRFLGDTARAVEIYNLNVGRDQPDGQELKDASKLDPGWYLVLPWDAVGAGVQYGLPGSPVATPSPSVSPSKPAKTKAPSTGAGSKSKGKPRTSTKPGTAPADGSTCAAAIPAGRTPEWARQKVGADRAWRRTRGKGELVAVVDSGVDGSLPQLTGHVAVGVDVVSGGGHGDVDCRGSGTAMGTIVVAQGGGSLAGVAPDATVMPIRVVTTGTAAEPADEATAITVAASAGATVIALGSYVDLNNAAVVRAIAAAVAHDVVVICAAPLSSTPVDPKIALPTSGVLRVGGVGEDGRLAAIYRSGAVDVLAPGVKVRSLGPAGPGAVLVTGTQYAVAFAAGEAALVRSAYPSLPAALVVDRIKETAAQPGDLIDPAAAVSADLADQAGAAHSGSRSRSGVAELLLLVLIGVVLLAALVLLIIRVRRVLQADPEGDPSLSGADTVVSPPWPVPSGRSGPGTA